MERKTTIILVCLLAICVVNVYWIFSPKISTNNNTNVITTEQVQVENPPAASNPEPTPENTDLSPTRTDSTTGEM